MDRVIEYEPRRPGQAPRGFVIEYVPVWNGRRSGPNGGQSLAAFANPGGPAVAAAIEAETVDAETVTRSREAGRRGGLKSRALAGTAAERTAARRAVIWALLVEPRRASAIAAALHAAGYTTAPNALAALLSKAVAAGVVAVVGPPGRRNAPGRYQRAAAYADAATFPPVGRRP